jgi:hypothetical protein
MRSTKWGRDVSMVLTATSALLLAGCTYTAALTTDPRTGKIVACHPERDIHLMPLASSETKEAANQACGRRLQALQSQSHN